MKSKKNISLKRVFLRNLLAGMLLPFVVILMVIALQVFRGVQNDKEDTYLTMAQMLADNIHESVQKYVAVVETAAYNENVTSMDADRAEAYLNQIIADSGNMWSHFLITDSEGIEIAHTDGAEHHGTSIADREYYLSPWKNNETVVCEPMFSKSTGRRILAIGTPVTHNGQQAGVLVGFVRLEYISEMLDDYSITPSNYVFMLNSDGMLAAHPDRDIVLLQNWLTGECDPSVSSETIDTMTENLKTAAANMAKGAVGLSPDMISYMRMNRWGSAECQSVWRRRSTKRAGSSGACLSCCVSRWSSRSRSESLWQSLWQTASRRRLRGS